MSTHGYGRPVPSAPVSGAPKPRRRRTAVEAEEEILAGALDYLSEHSWADVTVERLMGHTTLSRASFYVYFREPRELLERLSSHLAADLWPLLELWLRESGEPRENARAALERISAVYERHGRVLRAISEAAAQDRELDAYTRGLVQRFIDRTAEHIEQESLAGRVRGLQPQQAATALVWMVERTLLDAYGRPPHPPRESVSRSLLGIWYRSLYLEEP